MKELDQHIRDYYEEQRLEPDRVERILEAGHAVRPPVWRQPAWFVAASAMCLLAFVSFLIYDFDRSDPTTRIAQDVLANHRKLLEPEVLSSNFAVIQTSLRRIDFPLTPTLPEMLTEHTVLGGRYCTIGGELAAQISLASEEGRAATLYIAPLTEELSTIAPGLHSVDGASIFFWHDNGRIFALIREP